MESPGWRNARPGNAASAAGRSARSEGGDAARTNGDRRLVRRNVATHDRPEWIVEADDGGRIVEPAVVGGGRQARRGLKIVSGRVQWGREQKQEQREDDRELPEGRPVDQARRGAIALSAMAQVLDSSVR
jgi:hypothetical protein